eukprot:g9981.t1
MSSDGGVPAAGGDSNQEDLEQRLGDRMDAALEQRMNTMMGVLSGRLESLLENALRGVGERVGERGESSGGERPAAGGNEVAPGVQSGTPGGAGISSIPGRTAAEDQEGLQVSGGFDNPRAKDDPIQALNNLELIWSQLNDKDGVELDLSFLLTKFIDILPIPEYEAVQNSLLAMKEPTRNDVVRLVTTQREKITRLRDEEKVAAQRKGQEQAYVTSVSNGKGSGKKGRGRGGGNDGGGNGGGANGGGGGPGRKGRCFLCHRKGHYADDCPFPNNPLPKCGNCGGYGHKADKCSSEEEKVEEANVAKIEQFEEPDSEEDQAF